MDRDNIISRDYDLINETTRNDHGASCGLMMKSSVQSGTATCGAESHPTAPHLFITQLSGVSGKGGCFLIEQ